MRDIEFASEFSQRTSLLEALHDFFVLRLRQSFWTEMLVWRASRFSYTVKFWSFGHEDRARRKITQLRDRPPSLPPAKVKRPWPRASVVFVSKRITAHSLGNTKIADSARRSASS